MGKVFNSLLYNLYAFGQILIAENGQILKTLSGHLVTLATTPKNHLTGKKFKAQLSHHFTTTTTTARYDAPAAAPYNSSLARN